MNPLRPTIQWEARSPHSLADDSMLQMYFGQTSAVQDAKLRPLGGGRSGARVYIAAITAEHSGMAVPLQPELVKIAADDCEVQNFRAFAEGTALVYGLKLARPPHVNPATGEVVFGFQLFESGADVSPLSALALADPGAARECLVKLISQLGEWYGVERSSTGAVTLPKGPAQIKDLIDGLARLSAPTARAVERSLDPDRLSRYPGVLTRVHGDLHLDNILAPRDGGRPYLIDFANSNGAGSPCLDIARLECDIIYRLFPFDTSPDDIAAFELSLWSDTGLTAPLSCAKHVLTALRQDLNIWQTPNAAIWLLIGRIVNALRMLAHTWVDVIPYKYDQRRRGIVASIKVLTEVIEGCFSGRIPKLPMGLNRPTAGMTDCIRSLDWLFGHRHYFDCFALAEAATASIQRPNASACLVGAIAGVNAGIAVDRVDGVAERTTSSLRSVRDRGLRSYLRALKASRSSPRNIPHILKRFSIARGHFHDAADQLYESIAMDQLARAHQDNGDIEPAKVCFAESIRLKGRIGDDVGLAASLGGLALLHMNTWEFTEARSLLLKDLESVQQREDIATEIRIHNWLGQIVLYADWNILEAIKDFEKSLRMAESFHGAGYDPVPDVAFAHIGMGFAYAAASTPQSALNSEQSARQYLKQMRGMAGDSAATICEILSGQILLLDGDSISAAIRLTGALHHLLEISALYHADYTVRLCNFLKQQDRQGLAARFAIPALRNPITSASSNLHRILTEFGEGS